MIKDGSFVLLDYVATIKETNEVFTSTKEEEARKADIYKAGEEYEPQLLVVGSNWFPKGLEEGLIGHDKGEQFTVELSPEKAYGSRDPSRIKSQPIRKFRNEGGKLQPGTRVEIDGKLGIIRSIGAGRVQVDFNPPLAGKNLVYALDVKDVIDDPVQRIIALLHRRMPSIPKEKFNPTLDGRIMSIEMPSEAFLIDGLQILKRAVYNDVTRFIPDVDEVIFVERYVKEKKETAEPKAETEPTPAAEAQTQSQPTVASIEQASEPSAGQTLSSTP